MELYSRSEDYRLYHGNCLDMEKVIAPNSIDSIITDPPYEIDFMGKSWDKSGIAFQKETWEHCYNVLKAGGYMLVFGGCYDEQTEYLTKQGWKLIKDATMSDEIVTLNPDSGIIEIHKPDEVVKFPYDGEMYHFKTNKVDLMVTGNHKMYVASLGHKNSKYRLERADSCYNKAIKMKKNATNDNKDVDFFVLPSVEKSNGHYTYKTEEIKIPMNVWLKFFGLYMAQGSSTICTSYKVKISHYVKEDLDIIEKELYDYFHICRYDNIGTLNINSKELCLYLQQFGKARTKHLPDWLKNCSMSQIRLFIEWYLRGDGDRKFDRWRGYTSSKQLASDFQELALYGGISADISVNLPKVSYIKGRKITANECYTIAFNLSQNEPEVYQKNKQNKVVEIGYRKDYVYCVEVPNHIIYVRRNGKACWCGNTRTFHRIACAIEDAGFEIRDTIMWLYGSGFIHSNDLGKYIESKVLFGNANTQKFKELQGEKKASGNWGISSGNERYDYRPADYTADSHLYTTKVDYQTEEGRQWDGWGYALKPSYEPIIVARKPCEGSLVDNILKYGTGGMNLKECKIGNDTIKGGTSPDFKEEGILNKMIHGIDKRASGGFSNVNRIPLDDHEGRFPTNTILTYDDSDYDEVCGGMPVGGRNGSISRNYEMNNNVYGKYEKCKIFNAYDDSGSASRYFYCAKATTWDREEGLEDLPEQLFHRMREDADNDKPTGLNKEGRFAPVIRKNIHPTVKPTSLMQYLIRLVTQNGGTVLDPFNGSGSTGKACMVENKERNKGYQYIGIELTEDYLPIAKGRIEWVLSVKTDPFKQIEVGKKPRAVKKDDNQMTLWDFFGDISHSSECDEATSSLEDVGLEESVSNG